MKTPRGNPEHKLQVQVKTFLTHCLPLETSPDYVEWTASAAGVRVSTVTAMKMKASGVRRGWPDLQFLFPDGVTRYIELKAGTSLSTEQRAFRDRCAPHGIFVVCKSVDDVERTLRGWGVKLRCHPFKYSEANDMAA